MSDTWNVTKLCDNPTEYAVSGITVDNNGIIYFTSWGENVYQARQDSINTEPQILVNIKGAMLHGILWNGNNILYICDNYNHRILSYSIDTRNLSTLAGNGKDRHKVAPFSYPYGIAMDSNGDLYITQLHCVRKINVSVGTVITVAGSGIRGHKDGDAKQASFSFPFGITVSDDDTIYVADRDNRCIRKIKDGIVFTIAGTGKYGYQDGPLNHSKFKNPKGLVLNVDGNLLVGDDHGLLRRVDLNQQMVSTIQGATSVNVCSLVMSNQFGLFGGGLEGIMKIENRWQWKRLIWIGHLKENPNDCLLAILPRDIINQMTQFM